MSVTTEEPIVAEDQRAPLDEQPLALAVAEELGTLPADDRRVSADPVACPSCAIVDHAGIGSMFERQPHGWKVKYMDGGATLFCEGATITLALASHASLIEPDRTEGDVPA